MSQNEGGNDLSKIQDELEAQGKLIRRIDRRMRYATYGSALKWLVYIGLALGAFVWLKPYLDAISLTAQKIQEGAGAVSGFREGFSDSWKDAWGGFVDSFGGVDPTDVQ